VGQTWSNGDVGVAYSAVSPGYLSTLKTPLYAGRQFDDRDLPNATQVALINRTMEREYFGAKTPLGSKS
jgi:hypothetical protein